jgi:hypothetical protein
MEKKAEEFSNYWPMEKMTKEFSNYWPTDADFGCASTSLEIN